MAYPSDLKRVRRTRTYAVIRDTIKNARALADPRREFTATEKVLLSNGIVPEHILDRVLRRATKTPSVGTFKEWAIQALLSDGLIEKCGNVGYKWVGV